MSTDNTAPKQSGLIPFKPGQSGNPAGRPKGARSKLGEAFLQDVLKSWEQYGPAALDAMLIFRPHDYVKVVASILPKEIDVGERTVNVLEELLARIDGRTRMIQPAAQIETAH